MCARAHRAASGTITTLVRTLVKTFETTKLNNKFHSGNIENKSNGYENVLASSY